MNVAREMSEDTPPEEAYALLANETRIEIVRALGEANTALTFSTLKERVGVRDSGGFNYHLQRLRGTFVKREACGYALTDSGEQVSESLDS